MKRKIIRKLVQKKYKQYFAPKSKNEDIARKEFIFNILIAGLFSLILLTSFISSIRIIFNHDAYVNTKPQLLLVPLITLLILYGLSRKRFSRKVVYGLISIYLILGTYSLFKYSYILPQGLLIFSLVIVIAGILISSRAALVVTALIVAILFFLSFTQNRGIFKPLDPGLDEPMQANLVLYVFIFSTIFIVSWLSSKEIEKSLSRARRSERVVKKQRDELEEKVKARTRELEKLQIEKAREMYKFSEFGRVSSSLLHDLANPLTAISLNLNQLNSYQKDLAIDQINQGISHMEAYINSARNQLKSKKESELFDSKTKIKQVADFLMPKAKSQNATIKLNLKGGISLYGDSSKFSQVVANLVANAIDAYENKKTGTKNINVKTKSNNEEFILSVRDWGTGIPDAQMSEIFEPFFTTKDERGTGIGLTITKRIIEEDFDGTIYAASSTVSTVFTVTFPIRKI